MTHAHSLDAQVQGDNDEGCHQKGSLGGACANSGADGHARHRRRYLLRAVTRGRRSEMVPVERIELPTFGLQNRCSTAELNRLMAIDRINAVSTVADRIWMPRRRVCLWPQAGPRQPARPFETSF